MSVEAVAAPVETTIVDVPVNATKIIKQVEFYFSDANLPRDRFLQEELKKSTEGWISIAVLASFTRMKVLSTELSAIVAALRSADEACLLEVSEDGLNVRRKTPLPEQNADNLRTCVLVRNFPVESTLEDLEAMFTAQLGEGKVSAIRMRRNPQTKAFKGSVYLYLKEESEATRLSELKSLVFSETLTCEILSLTAFMEEQNAKQMARKAGKSEESAAEEAPLTVEDVKEMVLTITGCPADLDHRMLRTALSSKGPVAFVENVTAEGCSVVRFKQPVAKAVMEVINTEGGIRMPNIETPLMAREATEDEVAAFFTKMIEFKAKAAANPNNNYKNNMRNKNKRFKRS